MNVPFVDLKKQYLNIKNEIDEAIKDVIVNTSFIGGTHVDDFSLNLSNLLGVKHSLPVANGTDALYISLKMLGLSQNDEVITSAHSWISSSEAITQAGGNPVFVDTNQNFCIDTDLIEESINENTRGIIPVHLFGHAANMEKICQIAKKYNLFVVEDCAQAILTKWDNQFVGTFGDVGTISFFPGKNLGAYGDAGGIITANENLFLKMKRYANHGSLSKHMHEIEGINSRLDSLQAAILNVKIKYIEEWVKRRNVAADTYTNFLSEIDEITLPLTDVRCDHTFHLYVIKTDQRDNLQSYLKNKGISSGIHYPRALPELDCYKYLNLDLSKYSNAISNCSSILSLPIYPEITVDQIKFVASNIKDFFSKEL